MKLNGWLAGWVRKTTQATLRRARRMPRRVEGLEQRCLLTVHAGLLPSPEWFAAVHPADPANSVGALSGANGVSRAISGDAIVGTWIVQLSQESLTTVNSPSAAEAVLDGYGADFTVLRGLGLPGQILVQASLNTRDRAEAALRSHPLVSMFEPDTYVVGPQSIEPLIPTDARFNDLVGLANTGSTGGVSDSDIDAPEAWSFVDSKLAPDAGATQVGSRNVVVGVIDSGMDYTHPDLVKNVFLNQGEIPAAIRAALVDTDGDGLITFVDLNASQNVTARQVSNTNAVSLIDGADLLADPDWANGQDNDNNGFIDDLIGWDFSEAQFDANGVVIENQKGDNNPGIDASNGGAESLHRHGTHVAGTIGAEGNNDIGVTGVSWAVSLLPLRFLDANNQGATSRAILAINYATMMKDRYQQTLTDPAKPDGSEGANIRITNNSWGGSSNASPQLREAIAAEGAVDILFVAAAGNGNALGRGNDTISGGEGADNLNGQTGNDSILGDNGNDVLVGGAGIDTMSGGLGNDFLSGQTEAGLLSGGEDNDTLQGNTANDTLNGDVGDDRLYGLQGDDVINAGDGADSLVGAIGNDSLNGGAGLDTLQGDLGNDTLDGGADFDRINEVFDTNVTIVGITVTTTGLGSDTVLAIERIQVSGGVANNFFDARLATVPVFLSGGAGNDTLLGGSKADGVIGGDDDDVLSGGAGADIIDGGNGNDYWFEKADTNFTVNGVTITSTLTGTDTPTNIERIALIGGVGANKLDASLATISVVLIGGRGNDTLIGSSQADTLTGGNRNDSTVVGGDGTDSLDGGLGDDTYEADALDTRLINGSDTTIADVFVGLPSWIDAI